MSNIHRQMMAKAMEGISKENQALEHRLNISDSAHISACNENAELEKKLESRDKEIAELKQAVRELYSEVDCRIGHGAESNGHLEYVKDRLQRIMQEEKKNDQNPRQPEGRADQS